MPKMIDVWTCVLIIFQEVVVSFLKSFCESFLSLWLPSSCVIYSSFGFPLSFICNVDKCSSVFVIKDLYAK